MSHAHVQIRFSAHLEGVVCGALRLLLACVVGVFAACSEAAVAQRQLSGQLLVKPKESLGERDFLTRLQNHGLVHQRALHRSNVRVLRVPNGDVEAAVRALAADPQIEYAEVDGRARAAFVVNDAYVANGTEWHLQKIQALAAWDYTVGQAQTIVAVLDSGINSAHPEFTGRVLSGYNFVARSADTSDDFGHGTAVAGTIGAAGNNSVGVAGVAYGCQLLPVKVVDATGFASYSDISDGIYFAVEHGARVINISIAGDTPSATLQAAIDFAWSNNVVVVAAAGNNANTAAQYPAACAHVVSASATTSSDSLADFSTYGTWVTLSAPGDNIWTTDNDLSAPYGSWRGTSFASPIVAGTAALLLSANPTLSSSQVTSLLATNADDLGSPGSDSVFGGGRVNALNSLLAAMQTAGAVITGPAVEPRPVQEPATNQMAFSMASLPRLSKYAGLIFGTNGTTTTNAGYFTISARSSGKFSGRLLIGGKHFGFSGQVDESGRATLSFARRLNTPMSLQIGFDAAAGTDQVFVLVAAADWGATGIGYRDVFQVKTNPAPYVGEHDFVLKQQSGAVTQAGTGAGKIRSNGSGRLRGRLSDGRRFAVASTIGRAGEYPFYLSRKRGSEVMLGWLDFNSADITATSGNILWLGGETGAEKLLEVAGVR